MNDSLVLIGAGSTVFTPGLLSDLATNPAFAGWTVHLVDLEADAAGTMAGLGRRIAAKHGADLRFEAHTDRRQALPEARFVTTTIAVGGAKGWLRDLEVPARYGIAQTVGDSVGPGGVLRALRHVPELVAIARDVEELAPGALLVNYSNPLTANVRGITAATGVTAIGLCHGTMHTLAALAADLRLPAAELHAVFAGLNHLCWLLDLRHGSEDVYPRLRELCLQPAKQATESKLSAERVGTEAGGREGAHQEVSADLLRTFGRYPAPGDRHVSEFFSWYLRGADEAALPWGLQSGRDDTVRYIHEKTDLWERLHAQADGELPPDDPRGQEAERLTAILAAIVTGQDAVELAVNLPNEGKIPNLPATAVVEVPAVTGAAGITGLAVGPLPDAIAAVLTARAQQQELTVQAALTGSRAVALQALALDPLVPDPATAAAILDDAVVAHAPLLDRFAAPEGTR
jgi:alpha-galactosidase/6-phospho-beta-glucosidase family protein